MPLAKNVHQRKKKGSLNETSMLFVCIACLVVGVKSSRPGMNKWMLISRHPHNTARENQLYRISGGLVGHLIIFLEKNKQEDRNEMYAIDWIYCSTTCCKCLRSVENVGQCYMVVVAKGKSIGETPLYWTIRRSYAAFSLALVRCILKFLPPLSVTRILGARV